MERWTRRKFLTGTAHAAVGTAALGTACDLSQDAPDTLSGPDPGLHIVVPLEGPWLFRTDPEKRGENAGWPAPGVPGEGWERVDVPHTWQVVEKTADYLGTAWYRRDFEAPMSWKGRVVRVEFEAVFHTAEIFVNGRRAGEHVGKGYTAFVLDITGLFALGELNTIAVRVDNAFAPAMLPRSSSYDWTPDGGITRPARLIVTPRVYLEQLWIDAVPDAGNRTATLAVLAVIRNATASTARLDIGSSSCPQGFMR